MARADIFHPDFQPRPYWWEAYMPSAGELVELPGEARVAIVGGGYAGLAAALELAKHGVDAVVLERGALGTMGPTTHAYGGTRMGDNPETNVVNRWGFSHEAPNLGILGASVMGTSGARNPTLTAQALAWRTAEYLARNWKKIAV